MHLRRTRLDVAEALWRLDEAYALADEAAESPRRRTLVMLIGLATMLVESADDQWNRGMPEYAVRGSLGVALQALVLLDLLAEVVVRDDDGRASPTAAELELHDRVRQTLAGARPALVMAADTASEEAIQPVVHDDATDSQSGTDTFLDLMLAVARIRELFEARSSARVPADRAARETAMLAVTLARHCLDRSVAALEALSDGEPDAAIRDLRAAECAATVCEELLPDDVAALRPLVADVLHHLEN